MVPCRGSTQGRVPLNLETPLAPGLPTALARAVANTLLPAARPGSPLPGFLPHLTSWRPSAGQSCPVLQRCKPKNIQQAIGQALIFLVPPMPDKKYFPWSRLQTYQMLNCGAINTPVSRKTKVLGLLAHMQCSARLWAQTCPGKEERHGHTDSTNSYHKIISNSHFFAFLCYIKQNLKMIIGSTFIVTFPNRDKISKCSPGQLQCSMKTRLASG